MAQNSSTATNAATSEQEMAALVSKVTALSKLALDMTRLCIEVNDNLPALVQSQVAAAVAAVTLPPLHRMKWTRCFPPGYLDNIQWYVVCVGRRPGQYSSYQDADDQVRNVPGQLWKRKDNRQEALLFYRNQFRAGECKRVSEAQPASHVAAPATTPGTSRGSAFLHSAGPSRGSAFSH
ncbi:hypothetical protein B0H14DRAFT_2557599 [Mycena olivaceomarginata]|nr:hypothetical protein B0H14DRAFT_2557599 [Mycena olivaceomarginata]